MLYLPATNMMSTAFFTRLTIAPFSKLMCPAFCALLLVTVSLQAQVKNDSTRLAVESVVAVDSAQQSLQFVVQDSLPAKVVVPAVKKIPYTKELTIVYNIAIKTKSKKAGIEETYNGGLKTIFIQGSKTRIRMVTLMRIQSLFFIPQSKPGREVLLLKEFGRVKYKTYLDSSNWLKLNEKYDSLVCEPTADTATILNYPCKKMLLRLAGGKEIAVFYTDSLRVHNQFSEPVFKCVPGLVLKYEYSVKMGSISYTASEIKTKKIDPSVFVIPQKGYAERKYCYDCEVKEFDLKENEEQEL